MEKNNTIFTIFLIFGGFSMKPTTRKRRSNSEILKTDRQIINLFINNLTTMEDIEMSDIKKVYEELGFAYLSTSKIRDDLRRLNIKHNGARYTLIGTEEPQQITKKLAKLIHHFEIFKPVGRPPLKLKAFSQLHLFDTYFVLKATSDIEQINEFSKLLTSYLNQVHYLYSRKGDSLDEYEESYLLDDFFFEVTASYRKLCFSINGREELSQFMRFIIYLKQLEPTQYHKRIALFYISPQMI